MKVQYPMEVTAIPGTTVTSAVLPLPPGRIVSVQPQQVTAAGWSPKYYLQICMMPVQSDVVAQQSCIWSGYIRPGCLGPSTPNLETVNGQGLQLLFTSSGSASATQVVRVIVTVETDLSIPPGGTTYYFEQPRTGRGAMRIISIANPAVATDPVVQSVPTCTIWRPLSFGAQLTTDINVANRNSRIRYQDATPSVFATFFQTTVTGSTTAALTWASGVGSVASSDAPLGDVLLEAGEGLRLVTVGLQAGDQWSQLFIRVEEWAVPS